MSANPYESLLRLAAEAPSAIIWATDPELRISECLGGALSRLDLSPLEEPSGAVVSDFFPKTTSNSSSFLAAHHRALAGETAPFEVEWDGQRFGGHVVPRFDDQLQTAGCVAFAREVTSATKTEHALQAARQVYRQLLEAISAYRYSVRVENGLSTSTEHNAACLSATGYTPEEYAADPLLWINMVHSDDRETLKRHVASVLGHEAVPPIEHRIRHKDGSVRWVRDTIVSHFDDAGALVRYDGLVEDITERKRVEERFRRFVESAPDGMVIIDHEGRIVLVNAATERLFGFAREELSQQPVEVLIPERLREGHSAKRDAYVAGPQHRLMGERELTCRRKDGTEFPAEISLSPIETEEGLLVAAAVREITQRKRMEGKIRANLQIQSTLTALLKLSLEPLTLEEQLERALDLLAAVPWIELESKGAVFLAEEGSEELVMKAQRGLGDSVVAGCGRLPLGHCLCGRAAATRAIVFASCLDERHEMCFPHMLPHGHYCVPILSGDELIGVINLYLKHGHRQTPDEEDFLAAAANVLAGIVKRKRAEESLRKSEERFELAVQGTEAGVWDWDLRTNQVYYSALWKRMLGYEEDEIEDEYTAWEGLLHPDDRQRALATVRDYLDGKTEEYELEHRLRHKNGSYRWILARGAVVRDVDGKPYRMVGSHLDVTERKLSERRLREREAQLLAAQHIQEHLLPPGSPSVPGFDIAGRVFPAEFAAGDYFDYLCFPDGALGIAIGDVCGHGVGAALLTATTIAHLRSLAEDHADVGEISAHANSMLCWETEAGRFVTNFLAHVDLKSRMVHYVGAGHPWGYVLSQSGDVKSILKSSAVPLAIMRETEFPVSGPVGLGTGDLVLLVTDGLLEAQSPDGVLFGTERTLELVRANRHLKASEIIEILHAAALDFTRRDELLDDLTAVVIKVEEPPASPDV